MKSTTKRIHPVQPIFQVELNNQSIFYTLGYLAVVEPEDAELIQQSWKGGKKLEEKTLAHQVGTWLKARARETTERRQQWLSEPFAPECLTI